MTALRKYYRASCASCHHKHRHSVAGDGRVKPCPKCGHDMIVVYLARGAKTFKAYPPPDENMPSRLSEETKAALRSMSDSMQRGLGLK